MKQFFALLAAISVVLLPVTSVFADDNGPPPVSPTITVQSVITNQSEVTQEEYMDGSSTVTIGSWTIRYSNAASYGTGGGNKYVRHDFARTEKVAGSGSYQAEAHAALIKGTSYGGQVVFSYLSHPCAESIVNNATAQACTSPWQLSSTGQQWLIISGHYFDIGINGVRDSECSGCIDWVFTTP